MARISLSLILVALLGAATGCRMCASPYDYCSPTFLGGDCEDCRPMARLGSTLSDDSYIGDTSPFEHATFDTLTEDNDPDSEPEDYRRNSEPGAAEPEPMDAPTEAEPLPLDTEPLSTEEAADEPAPKPVPKQAARWHSRRR